MVTFTQFLRPNGQRKMIDIELAPEVEKKAYDIVDAGYRFEIEVLMTGHVSATIAGWHPVFDEDNDVAIKVMNNGPEVPDKIGEMIMEFVIPQKGMSHD